MHRLPASLVAATALALVAFPLPTLPALASAAADCDSRFDLEAEYYVFEAGAAPASIVTGDWNEDGIPDFATANAPTPKWGRTHSLSILLGEGGGFRLRTLPPIPMEAASRCLRTADFNRDGHADLVVTGDGGTSIWIGDGRGGFAKAAEYPIVGVQLEVGNLDGDEVVDLAIVRPRDGFTVALLDGIALRETRDVSGYVPALKLGDFDEDGDLDVATGDAQGVAIRINDGAAHFGAPSVFTTPCGEYDSIESLAVGHLNADTHLDVIGIGIRIWGACGVQLLGRGDGTFEPRRAFPTPELGMRAPFSSSATRNPVSLGGVPGNPRSVELVDLSGDGVDEIVTLSDLASRAVMGTRSATGAAAAAFADVDGDGHRDVIAAGFAGVVVHPGVGDGSIRRNPLAAIHDPWAAKMIDLDGDGHQDLAVYSDGGLEVVYGALGGFGPRVYPPGNVGMSFDVADVDGDGQLDLLSEYGEFVRGLGGRRFEYPGIRFLDRDADALACGDWDDDGRVDLVIVPHDSIGIVVLLTGDGHGEFQRAGQIQMRARRLAFADIDQDGHLDLFASELFAASISFGDGSGNFSEPVVLEDPGFYPDLIRGDFDEDGSLDLAGDQAVFLRRGRTFVRVETPVNAEAVADLDGDGHLDLVSGGVFLGDGRAGFRLVASFGPRGMPFVDDRDHDGYPDLIVLTRGDGEGNDCTATWIPNRSVPNHAPLASRAIASLARSWPADHSWAHVTIDGVCDPDGDALTIEVTRIRQDEPTGEVADGAPGDQASPARRDLHCPDGAVDHGHARVRLERDGDGNGRVYTIDFVARDACGASSEGAVTVCVPRRPGAACVDDGPLYDAVACPGHAVELESPPEAIEGLRARPAGPGTITLDYVVTTDEPVSLEIYDVSGRRLARLESAPLARGAHERTWTHAPGIYFARLTVGARSYAKPIILVR